MEQIFFQIAIVIALAVIISFIMKALKQPLIIGYIISGIIAGPYMFNILTHSDIPTIKLFSEIGIALLLFLVGLNLNPKVIKEVGSISLITGVSQVLFTTGIGFLILKALSFSTISALYLSMGLAFSSTIIIMKILTDKGDTERLYGKIAIGFLIVQDLIAIFIMMALASVPGEGGVAGQIFFTVIKGIGVLAVLLLFGQYVLPKIMDSIAKNQEMLLLFSISWALLIGILFHNPIINFSMEVGALIAGITLSMSPYRFEISCKLKPVRDFFLLLFFIFLGIQMSFAEIAPYIGIIIILSLFVVIGNPIIVIALMGYFGYTKRNGFLAGLTVAQISEFSLILAAYGVGAGHIEKEMLSVLTAIGILTIGASSYLMIYSDKIYPKIANLLSIFEKKGIKEDEHKQLDEQKYEVILFGYNSIGYDLLHSFEKLKKKYLVIDYDPEVIRNLTEDNINCLYGDLTDTELLEEMDFSKTKMAISTITDFETNVLLINKIRKVNFTAIVIVISHNIDEAMNLYKNGASYVIMPHFLGGIKASGMIEEHGLSIEKFVKEKLIHIDDLVKRKKSKIHKEIDNN
jgi:Kef-type K+ transport system membrane component KefB/Trk K+ transport system NAD-binding subunit